MVSIDKESEGSLGGLKISHAYPAFLPFIGRFISQLWARLLQLTGTTNQLPFVTHDFFSCELCVAMVYEF